MINFFFVSSYSQFNFYVVENTILICIHKTLHPLIFEAQHWVNWWTLGSLSDNKQCSRKIKPAGLHVWFKAVLRNREHSRVFWNGKSCSRLENLQLSTLGFAHLNQKSCSKEEGFPLLQQQDHKGSAEPVSLSASQITNYNSSTSTLKFAENHLELSCICKTEVKKP